MVDVAMGATTERYDVILPDDINFITNAAIPIQISSEVEPEVRSLMANFGSVEMANVGAAISFNMLDPAVIGLITDFAAAKALGITLTTRRQIALVLAESVMRGFGAEQTARLIREKFAQIQIGRARVIARTEVNGAANAARHIAHRQSGLVQQRRWIATRDGRTRDNHASLNGQVVDLDQPFTIPGTARRAMHPGGFGIPEEDIQCRCTIVPIVARAAREERADLDPPVESSSRDTIEEFDRMVLRWEGRIERAIRRGMVKQERAVIAELRRQDRPAQT